jgi:predicted dehydrogenase
MTVQRSKVKKLSSVATRRQFLRSAAAVSSYGLALPYFMPARSLGRDGAVAPSDRVTMGWVGTGGQGRALMDMFLHFPQAEIVAVCNVDDRHLRQALGVIDERRGGHSGVASYRNYQELIGRRDIDAVVVATPDHWHAMVTIAALNSGKDVYCEKPLANSVFESRAVVNAVKQTNRILQVGSMERSNPKIRHACELVRNGRIGKVHTVRINLPDDDGYLAQARATRAVPPEPVPPGLDWDSWLGHTPQVSYTPKRCHFWWRFILAYGGGEMADRGAHVIDLAGLGLGTDEKDVIPIEYEASGRQNGGSLYDSWWDYKFTCTYPDGVKMIGSNEKPRGIKFEGDEGWISINIHGGELQASDERILRETIGPQEVQLGRASGEFPLNHRFQFLQSVKSRKPGFAPAEAGHRTAVICQLNNIAMSVGRRFKWDAKTERTDNDEANRLLRPTFRPPYLLGSLG